MIVDVARKLASFVNIKKNMDSLEIYMESRIEDMHKVLEQTQENTEVHKINDKLFHVFVQTTVKDDNTDELIIIKGQFSYISGNRGVIESVSTYYDTKINKGDIFHTTSSSNIYPKGIKVAEVISVKYDNKKNYLDIVVRILTELDDLEDVFIIK